MFNEFCFLGVNIKLGKFDNRIKNLTVMKNLIYITLFSSLAVFFMACEKETPEIQASKTDYYYSLKGKKHMQMKAQIYEVDHTNPGTCTGIFVKCKTQHFEYLLEIADGLPEELQSNENLENMDFILDMEYTGISYNCTNGFKKPSNFDKQHPVEIQQIRILKIEEDK